MFYFEGLLNQALAGIDSTAIVSTVVGIAYAILVVGFLISLYQAALRGGDLQALAVVGIKYLVVAALLANWTSVFREVNTSFNQVADFIGSSSGAGDMFMSWMKELYQDFPNHVGVSLTNVVTGDFSSGLTTLLIVVAYVVYVLATIIFGFFYAFYGCLLYGLGPLVLALLPLASAGQLAKSYATNVMIWNAWGLIYAMLGALLTAVHANHYDAILNNGFIGFLQGSVNSVVLGVVSVFYALTIVLIPFIAKRLISGDVGSSMYAIVRAGSVALGTAVAAGMGAAAGAGTGAISASAGSGSGAGTATGGAASASTSSSTPPQPSIGQTIRQGVMKGEDAPGGSTGGSSSAGNGGSGRGKGGSSPKGSSSNGGGKGTFGAQNGNSANGAQYRPQGLAQTAAYHAGRMAGSMISSGSEAQAEDTKESKS
jgi:F420-0:gamma-glutamyl ligase-like protein